ncbi:MAG: TolC family protein [Thermodesulfobacteriota bacterium]
MPIRLFRGFLLVLLVSGPAAAQAPSDSGPLTLSAAVQQALDQNPGILAARSRAESSGHMVAAARSGLMPQVNVSETFQNTTNPMWAFGTRLNQGAITAMDFDPDRLNDPEDISNFNTALTVDWPLYDGGKTIAAFSQARLQGEIGALALKRTEQEIISKTAQAYVGLLLAKENLAMIDRVLETARARLNVVQSRFDGGFVVKSDLLRAQVHIADLTQQRLSAESRVKVAAATLNAAMGRPMDTALVLSDPFETCVEMEAGDPSPWIEKAKAFRPDLAQLRLAREVAARQVDVGRSGHLPHVMLNGAYEVNSESFDDTADSYTVGAMVRMNLFAGNGVSAAVRAAKADEKSARALYEAQVQGVEIEVRQAFFSAQSAWQRIAVARQAVALAEEALRIVSNRYAGGLMTMVDLLDAQTADQQARTLYFQALHDYKAARIQLAAAAGVIDANFQ